MRIRICILSQLWPHKYVYLLQYKAVQNSWEFNCCLTCDVSFAPPAAVWIALNPTQVTMPFTGSSHLILPLVNPLLKPHLSGYQCSTRSIETLVVSHFLLRPHTIYKREILQGGKHVIVIPLFDPPELHETGCTATEPDVVCHRVHVFITNV